MMNTLLIFFGAGLGGVVRYWVSNSVHLLLGRHFPYGTLVVNVSGCFLMGFLFIILLERFNGMGSQFRSFLLIGFLGGYTTFSAFSIETLNLLEKDALIGAMINILLSVILCLLAAWLGMIGGKNFIN